MLSRPTQTLVLSLQYQSLMNELTGRKDTDNNGLSFADRKSLMTGSKIAGPTLAITAGFGASAVPESKPIPSTTFNANGSMNIGSDQVGHTHTGLRIAITLVSHVDATSVTDVTRCEYDNELFQSATWIIELFGLIVQ